MIRFGTAGYHRGSKDGPAAAEAVSRLGLDALELQFGRQVNLSDERAEAIGVRAKQLDVRLSAHAPYYISLSSKTETVQRSKEWILRTARAASKAGARIIVIHPASYMGKSPDRVTEDVRAALGECLEEMERQGYDVTLGVETMGKQASWGTLEEIRSLVRSLPEVRPVVDFAHIHARGGGSLRTTDDFRQVLQSYASISPGGLHCHYSCIEYNAAGERRHLPLEARDPDFRLLVPALREAAEDCTLICETPFPETDAVRMRDAFRQDSQPRTPT